MIILSSGALQVGPSVLRKGGEASDGPGHSIGDIQSTRPDSYNITALENKLRVAYIWPWNGLVGAEGGTEKGPGRWPGP